MYAKRGTFTETETFPKYKKISDEFRGAIQRLPARNTHVSGHRHGQAPRRRRSSPFHRRVSVGPRLAASGRRGPSIQPSETQSSRSRTARHNSSASATPISSMAAAGPTSSARSAPRSPRRSTPSTTSRSAGDAVTNSTSGIAANGAWAARSVCEPPISNSTGSSPSSKPLSRSGSTGASELGRQSEARLPQPSPDPTHAPQHDHAQAQSARKPARRRSRGLNLTGAFTPRKDALAAIPELGQVWRARSTERLEQALDNAQSVLLRAMESDDPHQRLTPPASC